MSVMRIANVGCGHGDLNAIYEAVKAEQAKKGWDTVDCVIIGGDFQAIRNANDVECISMPAKYRKMGDFHEYYSGKRVAPYLTIFCGGNHEASNYLYELYHGGWVAPNIYYLGASNVINLGPIRIAGMSGIFKGFDYRRPHFERLPYNSEDVKSIYHVRELDTRKLMQLRTPVDICISHDWPRGIEKHGDTDELFKKKKHLRSDSESGKLGNPAAAELLDHVRPRYWLSAHLHTRFATTIAHDNTPIRKRKRVCDEPEEWQYETYEPAAAEVVISSEASPSPAKRAMTLKVVNDDVAPIPPSAEDKGTDTAIPGPSMTMEEASAPPKASPPREMTPEEIFIQQMHAAKAARMAEKAANEKAANEKAANEKAANEKAAQENGAKSTTTASLAVSQSAREAFNDRSPSHAPRPGLKCAWTKVEITKDGKRKRVRVKETSTEKKNDAEIDIDMTSVSKGSSPPEGSSPPKASTPSEASPPREMTPEEIFIQQMHAAKAARMAEKAANEKAAKENGAKPTSTANSAASQSSQKSPSPGPSMTMEGAFAPPAKRPMTSKATKDDEVPILPSAEDKGTDTAIPGPQMTREQVFLKQMHMMQAAKKSGAKLTITSSAVVQSSGTGGEAEVWKIPVFKNSHAEDDAAQAKAYRDAFNDPSRVRDPRPDFKPTWNKVVMTKDGRRKLIRGAEPSIKKKNDAEIDIDMGTSDNGSPEPVETSKLAKDDVLVAEPSIEKKNNAEIDIDMGTSDDDSPAEPVETSKLAKHDVPVAEPSIENKTTDGMRSKLPPSLARLVVHEPRKKLVPKSITNKMTKFLALDKPGGHDPHVELLEVPVLSGVNEQEMQRPFRLTYDKEWLAITRVFAKELELNNRNGPVPRLQDKEVYDKAIEESLEWVEENVVKAGKLEIPMEFIPVAPLFDPALPLLGVDSPPEYPNPQTQAFYDLIGIPNKFALTDEEIKQRMAAGPPPLTRPDFDTTSRRGFGGHHRGRVKGNDTGQNAPQRG